VAHAAGLQTAFFIVLFDVRGDGNYGDARRCRIGAQGPSRFESIHFRQLHVHENDIGIQSPSHLETAMCVLSGRDVEIICGSGDGTAVERHMIGELIPFGFGPANLAKPG